MGHPFHLHTAVSDEIQKIAQTDPERAAEMVLGNTDGLGLFESLTKRRLRVPAV